MDRRTFTWITSTKDKTGLNVNQKENILIRLTPVIILLISLTLTGCDKYTRYEVLSFFFTGVPHPDEVREEKEEETLSPQEILRKRREEFKITVFFHGPFAAQQCYQCHSTSKSAVFRTTVKLKQQRQRSAIKSVQEIAGRLIKPLNELCIDCHSEKSVETAYNRGLWIHGPVSFGLCTVCHGPHASPYPYMLLRSKTKEMCRSCHAEGYVVLSEEHKKDMDCTECHNPHVGKNRFLLKKEFDENMLW